MGLLECDDGNIISNDGCSSTCQIEDDFKCIPGELETPDICKEIIPPYISSFTQSEMKYLNIQFSEPIQFLRIKYHIYIYIYRQKRC